MNQLVYRAGCFLMGAMALLGCVFLTRRYREQD